MGIVEALGGKDMINLYAGLLLSCCVLSTVFLSIIALKI